MSQRHGVWRQSKLHRQIECFHFILGMKVDFESILAGKTIEIGGKVEMRCTHDNRQDE